MVFRSHPLKEKLSGKGFPAQNPPFASATTTGPWLASPISHVGLASIGFTHKHLRARLVAVLMPRSIRAFPGGHNSKDLRNSKLDLQCSLAAFGL